MRLTGKKTDFGGFTALRHNRPPVYFLAGEAIGKREIKPNSASSFTNRKFLDHVLPEVQLPRQFIINCFIGNLNKIRL